MVEFNVDDYSEILDWFGLAFGKKDPSKISLKTKRTFWKLTLLAEDKIEELTSEEE
jgi:hypothetical protein